MKVDFKASFSGDLKGIKNQGLLRQIQGVIERVESAESIHDIPNLKRLQVEGRYYRIRIGDYRIGLIIEAELVTFVRFLHRSEVYRFFP